MFSQISTKENITILNKPREIGAHYHRKKLQCSALYLFMEPLNFFKKEEVTTITTNHSSQVYRELSELMTPGLIYYDTSAG